MSATPSRNPVEAVQRISAVPTILRLITDLTGLRLSLVAEVTEDRWLCCAVNDQLGFGLSLYGELCDRSRVAQAIGNLHSNALQHGDKDTPVVISTCWIANAVRIDVTNTGPAIPADRLATMFLPYQRGDAVAPRTGLGLGLFIVSEIARAHGGRVDCFAGDGRTTFALTLPRRPVSPP